LHVEGPVGRAQLQAAGGGSQGGVLAVLIHLIKIEHMHELIKESFNILVSVELPPVFKAFLEEELMEPVDLEEGSLQILHLLQVVSLLDNAHKLY